MFAEIFNKVFKYAQTLGKEDVLTALMTTMFDFSNDLMLNFLKNSKIACSPSLLTALPNPTLQTGITYFSNNSETLDYTFRPDLLIATSGFTFNSSLPFILIESKIYSSLTHNQYIGYSEIKSMYGEAVHIILISNYTKNEYCNYFDAMISWDDLLNIISDYIENISATTERIILKELLDSFLKIGIEYNEYAFFDIESLKPIQDFVSLSSFVKAMRKNLKMTQEEFANEVGVGLRFIRELEQGNKITLRTDKINQVLAKFDCELGPIKKF